MVDFEDLKNSKNSEKQRLLNKAREIHDSGEDATPTIIELLRLINPSWDEIEQVAKTKIVLDQLDNEVRK
ncbi:hypothetical protein [Rhizobium sp. BR 315]|uniref:hypothetical protein n=1 Tax=Rhizobium sp. BR 315 TaxID=3040014 RepID=UPI003D32ABA8